MTSRSFVLIVAIAFAACSHSPSAPTNTTPTPPAWSPIVGVWQVQYQITQDCCDTGFTTPPPLPYPVRSTVFRLLQSGTTVSGMIFGVDVSGTVAPSGSAAVVLTGTKVPASAYDTQIGMTATLQPSVAGDSLSGSFAYTTTHRFDPGGLARPDTKTGGTIANATRTLLDTSPSSFEGTWQGSYAVQGCAPANDPGCAPIFFTSLKLMTLALTQDGPNVTGQLSGSVGSSAGTLTVSGTVNGGVLTLTGSAAINPPHAGAVYADLLSFSATRDPLGRMSGSFTYSNELHNLDGIVAGRWTYDAAIASMLLSPN